MLQVIALTFNDDETATATYPKMNSADSQAYKKVPSQPPPLTLDSKLS